MRGSLPATVLVLASLLSGCASLDRESYSLVFAKKAHRYQDLSPVQKTFAKEQAEMDDLEGRVETLSVDMHVFKPFTFCYHHESSHFFESLIAAVAAPVEYPVAFTLNTTVVAAHAVIRKIVEIIDILFPGQLPIPDPRKKKKDEPPR